MPEIVYPGQVSFLARKSFLPYDPKVIAKGLYRIRLLAISWEKISSIGEYCGYPAVIADEINSELIADVNPSAFRPL